LRPQWNTIAKTNAVVIFDRLLRDLIRDTLPLQDFAAGEKLQVPLPADVRRDSVSVVLPNQTAFELAANDDTGEQATAVAAFSATDRGVYRLTVGRKDSSEIWDFPLAVNGAAVESDLTKAGDANLARFAAGRNVTLTNSGDSVSIRGLFQPRAGWAWWLVVLVLTLLMVESGILTASSLQRSAVRRQTSSPAALPSTTIVQR
jgi:hypothetical protein